MKFRYQTVCCLTVLMLAFVFTSKAQDYVSATNPARTGRAPGVQVKAVDTSGSTKTYVLIFSKGDEVVSGLTEFAQKYQVKSAHYTGIGDATTAKVGWYDYERKMFKIIPLNEPAEITSLIGDIAMFNGKPVAHSHINLATSDGTSHGGHLLEAFIGPTLEVFVTVHPVALNKKLNKEFEAGVIDPSL
ncbi:DNA-binding protein [Danxiaibacter flavus]|uniref:DNA-binding protein n=1 Tax=Danxiaibacter flavus TaxID=3049108 RepID=A0ABV3ZJW6_9BACT|nr:DNA-binding protein [Chitinophagaceae bacterium DXS]